MCEIWLETAAQNGRLDGLKQGGEKNDPKQNENAWVQC